jgi:hypothetical protein
LKQGGGGAANILSRCCSLRNGGGYLCAGDFARLTDTQGIADRSPTASSGLCRFQSREWKAPKFCYRGCKFRKWPFRVRHHTWMTLAPSSQKFKSSLGVKRPRSSISRALQTTETMQRSSKLRRTAPSLTSKPQRISRSNASRQKQMPNCNCEWNRTNSAGSNHNWTNLLKKQAARASNRVPFRADSVDSAEKTTPLL